MRKNIKLSLIIIFILIVVCAAVVIWNPARRAKQAGANSSTQTSLQTIESSSAVSDSKIADSSFAESSVLMESSVLESSILVEDSAFAESSDADLSASAQISDLVPEDQPETPNLNFETSSSSYDDIMVNVLTCLLTKDTTALSSYVGAQGLRLSPTGSSVDSDVVLSAADLAGFFTLSSQNYGTYPGSGENITLTAAEYYDKYIVPTGFDFSTAVTSYNDSNDIAAVSGFVSDPKTISYEYAPNAMEWQRIILVYGSEGSGDVLCGIIYQDVTTD